MVPRSFEPDLRAHTRCVQVVVAFFILRVVDALGTNKTVNTYQVM